MHTLPQIQLLLTIIVHVHKLHLLTYYVITYNSDKNFPTRLWTESQPTLVIIQAQYALSAFLRLKHKAISLHISGY